MSKFKFGDIVSHARWRGQYVVLCHYPESNCYLVGDAQGTSYANAKQVLLAYQAVMNEEIEK